jgi:hypothetical protein
MDKISEGKDASAFLFNTAENSKKDANRLVGLDWY